MKKLRIRNLRFGTGDREWRPLNDEQIPDSRVVRATTASREIGGRREMASWLISHPKSHTNNSQHRCTSGELPCPKMAPATGLVLADVHYDAADLHYDPAAHDAWRGTPLRTKAQHAAAAAAAAADVYYPEPKRARVDGELPAGGLLVEHQSPLGEMDS
jgi:hypothetical protein